MPALSLYSHVPDDVIAQIGPRPCAFPSQVDAVVIGGGIVGASCAYELSRRGLSVALIERDKIASQQSGRNWGFVRTQYRDPAELPLAVEALSIWPTLERELGREIGWRRSGCVFVAENEAEYETFAQWQAATREIARDARMLNRDEARDLLPALASAVPGALFTASDGQAEPALATLALARAAEDKGALILEDCGALAIETAGGCITGVLTEHGLIGCTTVVCAAGAQAHRFLKPLGLTLPQQIVRSTVSLTAPMAELSAPCFCGFGLGLRQRADGSCILAADSSSDIDVTLDSMRAAGYFLPELLRHRKGFALRLGRPFIDDVHARIALPEHERLVTPRRPRIPANAQKAADTAGLFARLFEGAGQARIVKSWAGQIDVLPDALPVIDAPPAVPGLIVATGFSGHGFGLGPAVGRHVARLAAGEQAGEAIRPFRLDRFVRGAYSRPHAPL
ncbi:Glycine/D-amino acid oxidase [Bosea sp. OK403]|uniref:NAD(P)/FAD-dependent oxidoreductase n=1 Tax=Bosea sp. OK403 TaxID=1855286 RepID=UPI0008E59689|nr:FAD-binding oxidoreductase [Bosea sp. OK403]SFI83581.1 Glycine/D-amino acid oxidase [Bosea sp. OK403]